MAVAFETLGRARLSAERRFFLTASVAMAAVVFVGFARSFFLHPLFPDHPRPPEDFFMLHGAVFAAWFVLLVVQASLVTTGRLAVHRQLGVLGCVLAAAMVVLGMRAGLVAAHRATGFVGVPIPALVFLVVPLAEIVLFSVLFVLAIVNRREPQRHKRFMLIASASLLSAAFARWPVVGAFGPAAFFGLADLFIVALAIWDRRSRGSLHPVTKWAGGAAILSQPLRLALASTPLWMTFAHWAVGFAP